MLHVVSFRRYCPRLRLPGFVVLCSVHARSHHASLTPLGDETLASCVARLHPLSPDLVSRPDGLPDIELADVRGGAYKSRLIREALRKVYSLVRAGNVEAVARL